MTGARVGTRKPTQPIATPVDGRDDPEHWRQALLVAVGGERAATNRKDRRYWHKAALHARAQLDRLGVQ